MSLKHHLTFSYTTFEYSDLELSAHHRAMNDSIQRTNERFLGHGDLYDVVVCPCHRKYI